MQLSLIVRGQHPPGDIAAHLRDDLDLVRRADELGFDGIVKGSHYSAHPFEYVQQVPFLAYAAAIAPRLRLICGLVLLPLHKPLDLAEQLATLDIMSGGKLVFGCGIGYRDVEFKAFGVPRAGLGKRFEECLEAVKRLWTEDFVDMKGSHFELDNANCTVKPLQQPTPPIWIGANADVAIRRAARMGDCWYINPHSTRWRRSSARWICTSARSTSMGKPFPSEVPMRREVFVAPSPGRGDPPGAALSRREIQGLSRLGAGQGHAGRRRFRPRLRRIAGGPLPAGLAGRGRRADDPPEPPPRRQPHRRLGALARHAEQRSRSTSCRSWRRR